MNLERCSSGRWGGRRASRSRMGTSDLTGLIVRVTGNPGDFVVGSLGSDAAGPEYHDDVYGDVCADRRRVA